MQGSALLGGMVKVVGVLLFCAGLFFITQAYTMAFHGVYIDCFTAACETRVYGEPTLTSATWGTILAIGALVTFYLGQRALRWTHKPRA